MNAIVNGNVNVKDPESVQDLTKERNHSVIRQVANGYAVSVRSSILIGEISVKSAVNQSPLSQLHQVLVQDETSSRALRIGNAINVGT